MHFTALCRRKLPTNVEMLALRLKSMAHRPVHLLFNSFPSYKQFKDRSPQFALHENRYLRGLYDFNKKK